MFSDQNSPVQKKWFCHDQIDWTTFLGREMFFGSAIIFERSQKTNYFHGTISNIHHVCFCVCVNFLSLIFYVIDSTKHKLILLKRTSTNHKFLIKTNITTIFTWPKTSHPSLNFDKIILILCFHFEIFSCNGSCNNFYFSGTKIVFVILCTAHTLWVWETRLH